MQNPLKSCIVTAVVLAAVASTEVSANSSRTGASLARLGALQERIEVYRVWHNSLPESLSVLFQDEATSKFEYRVLDAWDVPLVYRIHQDDRLNYDLYSVGRNGQDEGGAGDDLSVSRPDSTPEVIAALFIGSLVAGFVAIATRRRTNEAQPG